MRRKWDELHPVERRESQRLWREANRERNRGTSHLWREANLEKKREQSRLWNRMHPEARQASSQKRRATPRGKALDAATIHNRRVQLNGISLAADTVLELKTDFDGFCPYCWEKIVKGHMDHVVPVTKGGTNARENLAWVCSTCNQQKGGKSLLEFRAFQENLEGAPQ